MGVPNIDSEIGKFLQFDKVKYDEKICDYLDSNNVSYEIINGLIVLKSHTLAHTVLCDLVFLKLTFNLEKMKSKCRAYREIRMHRLVGNKVSVDFNVPDISVVQNSNSLVINGHFCGIPELVVEVLSTNKNSDLKDKLVKYANIGIPEYWIIDIDKRVLLQFVLDYENMRYEATFKGYFEGDVKHHICGLSLDLGQVFEELSERMKDLGCSDDEFQGTQYF